MRRSFAWVGGLALLGFGCGGGGGGHCTPLSDVSGLWAGTASHDDIAPNSPGTVSAAITQNGCTLGGTWTFTFGDVQLDKTLQISGDSPDTAVVAMKLNECATGVVGACQTLDQCTFVVSGALVSPTEINGTFATNDRCSQSETGTFDITFQAKLTPTPVPPVVTVSTPTPAPPTPTPVP